MERAIYERMAAIEDVHWWFSARRQILDSLLRRLKLPEKAKILEVGCGTGGNLAMLARHGEVYAMESDEPARDFARQRGCAKLAEGRLPDKIPFGALNFDLIAATDVLEHLADAGAALRALRSRLVGGGSLMVTVPAFAWLWSAHDISHHHYRRYDAAGLRELVGAAGYQVQYVSYFNSVLFPAIAGARLFHRALGRNGEGHDLSMPPAPLNRVLTSIFSFERHLIGRVSLPIGVSIVLLARN